mgnify:CR=1 FL=1
MKKSFLLIAVIIILSIVDYFVFYKTGVTPQIAEHQKEFLKDWFTGSALDYVGLISLHLIWIVAGFKVAFESNFYEEVGSSGKSIAIFFVGSIASIILIYI